MECLITSKQDKSESWLHVFQNFLFIYEIGLLTSKSFSKRSINDKNFFKQFLYLYLENRLEYETTQLTNNDFNSFSAIKYSNEEFSENNQEFQKLNSPQNGNEFDTFMKQFSNNSKDFYFIDPELFSAIMTAKQNINQHQPTIDTKDNNDHSFILKSFIWVYVDENLQSRLMLESIQMFRKPKKKQWLTNYINMLKKTPIETQIPNNVPSVNDIVISLPKTLKRKDWKVGIITKIKRSVDGKLKNLQLLIEGLHTWYDMRNFVPLKEL